MKMTMTQTPFIKKKLKKTPTMNAGEKDYEKVVRRGIEPLFLP